MELKVVPAERVPQIWSEVEGFLVDALQYSKGDYRVDHVQTYLSAGTWMLVIVTEGEFIHGAIAVQFFNRPTQRVAFVVAVGGYMISKQSEVDALKHICKAHGATVMEGAARESAARLWSRVGLTEKYKIMEVLL